MKPLTIAAASAAASKLRLRALETTTLAARLLPALFDMPAAKKLAFQLGGVDVLVTPGAPGGALRVRMPMAVDVAADGVAIARVEVAYLLDYSLLAELEDEEARSFAGISGYLHCFPYFRSDVQMLTTRLGLPPLTLPPVSSGDCAERVRVTLDAQPPINQGKGALPRSRAKAKPKPKPAAPRAGLPRAAKLGRVPRNAAVRPSWRGTL